MRQIVLTQHRAEHIEAKADGDVVAIVQRYGPKFKVIVLNWEEAIKLARFIENEARKEMEQCRTLKAELAQRLNFT